MAGSTTITFSFPSDTEGFIATKDGARMVWDSGSETLLTELIGVNQKCQSAWTLNTTWAALGVPADTFVYQIDACSMRYRTVKSAGLPINGYVGPVTMTDGVKNLVLSKNKAIGGVMTGKAMVGGVEYFGKMGFGVAGGWDSNLGVTITDNVNLITGTGLSSSSGTHTEVEQDQLTFTVYWYP